MMLKDNKRDNLDIVRNNGLENKNNSDSSFSSELKNFYLEVIKIAVVSLIVVMAVKSYVMQPFIVSGKSMEPNFYDGDYLIVDEISYRMGEPRRGDVIIFKNPNKPKEFFIKRIIGLPEERVEIGDSRVVIYNSENQDGVELDESIYIPAGIMTSGSVDVVLKNDEYYVLGDNRNASADSRAWGTLEEHFIVGRAWVRAWPFDSFSVFEGVEY